MMRRGIIDIGLGAITLVLLVSFVVRVNRETPSAEEGSASLSGGLVQQGAKATKEVQNSDTQGVRTVTPSVSPSVTVTPTVSPSATPSVTSTPTATLSPTKTPTMTVSLTPTPSQMPQSQSSVTPLPTPPLSPTPTPTQPASAAHVVINEIAWAGTAASQYGEWLELYNADSNAVDLTGWGIFEASGDVLVPLSGTLLSGQYFLIERTTPTSPDPISDIVPDMAVSFGAGGLNNGGERLELRNSAGVPIDTVDCSSGWYAGTNNPKATMERVDPNENGTLSTNWASNTGVVRNGLDADGELIAGTPRARNSAAK